MVLKETLFIIILYSFRSSNFTHSEDNYDKRLLIFLNFVSTMLKYYIRNI